MRPCWWSRSLRRNLIAWQGMKVFGQGEDQENVSECVSGVVAQATHCQCWGRLRGGCGAGVQE